MASSTEILEEKPIKDEDGINKLDDDIDIEAEIAYQNLIKCNSTVTTNDDDDEFAGAFETEKQSINVSHTTIPVSSVVTVRPVITDAAQNDGGANANVCDEKVKKLPFQPVGEDASMLEEGMPQADTAKVSASSHQNKHITVQLTNPLSPTNSMCSQPSSASSDPSLGSDLRVSLPHERRTRQQKFQSFEEAKEEWEHVETVTAGSKAERFCSPLVTFEDALTNLKSKNLDEYARNIKPTIKRSGFNAVWNFLSGPPTIANTLKKERDFLFTLGLCPFDNQDPMHNRILQTVYKKLTATTLDCPRHGSHWEEIGFQGEDPATDLRGCGMLGLMNILFFCTDNKTQYLCRDIFRLSQDEVQNFPFCVMGINITRIVLQVLRDGKLNKESNQQHAVIKVFNELYVAVYLGIYRHWKTQQNTISDSGFVLREIETAVKKNPSAFTKVLQKTLQERSKVSDSPVSPKAKGATADKIDAFSGICDLGDHEEEEVNLV